MANLEARGLEGSLALGGVVAGVAFLLAAALAAFLLRLRRSWRPRPRPPRLPCPPRLPFAASPASQGTQAATEATSSLSAFSATFSLSAISATGSLTASSATVPALSASPSSDATMPTASSTKAHSGYCWIS